MTVGVVWKVLSFLKSKPSVSVPKTHPLLSFCLWIPAVYFENSSALLFIQAYKYVSLTWWKYVSLINKYQFCAASVFCVLQPFLSKVSGYSSLKINFILFFSTNLDLQHSSSHPEALAAASARGSWGCEGWRLEGRGCNWTGDKYWWTEIYVDFFKCQF